MICTSCGVIYSDRPVCGLCELEELRDLKTRVRNDYLTYGSHFDQYPAMKECMLRFRGGYGEMIRTCVDLEKKALRTHYQEVIRQC